MLGWRRGGFKRRTLSEECLARLGHQDGCVDVTRGRVLLCAGQACKEKKERRKREEVGFSGKQEGDQ